jgi:undecaprenyl-diphosphatase
MIIVATIPTAIIGFTFGDFFDTFYTSIVPIGVGLIITGILLVIADKMRGTNKGIQQMTYGNAFFVGLVQGVAILPGVSRSGSTLFGSLLCGLDRKFAVKFVFLISIPSILGSAILELPVALDGGITSSEIGPVLVGMVVAAISGLIAIKTMIRVVSNKKLEYFSYYVWALGTIVILYGLFS